MTEQHANWSKTTSCVCATPPTTSSLSPATSAIDDDPFPWDPAERRQLRARLDALFFHLYGLDYNDTTDILDQFPVLEKNDRIASTGAT